MASSRLIYNIKQLVNVRRESRLLRGREMAELPCIDDAWVRVEGDEIGDFGEMSELPVGLKDGDAIDAAGRLVLPAWCDSHTHLVYSGSREEEFVDKIRGRSYAEIAAGGGGILNSARQVAEASEDQLFNSTWQRLGEVMRMGTGAIEIKSGYGLTVDSELKMLRVIKRLKERSPVLVRATFLGAHTYPAEYREDHGG